MHARRCRRLSIGFALAAACASLLVVAHGHAQPAPPAPTWIITGARILDAGAGRYLAPAAVVIEGGRIKSVTPSEPAGLPADTRRLDVPKATLVPGLIDVRAAVSPTAEFDTDYFMLLGLAHGATGYRALNLRTAWAEPQKRRIDSGVVTAPRLWVGGRGIDRGARPDLWLADAANPSLAAAEAARQVAANVDWIAGYDHLPADAYRAMVAAVKGSKARVAGMPGAASMADLAAAGVASIDTLAWPLAPRPAAADDPAAPDRAWTDAQARDIAALTTKLVRARVTLVPMLARAAARAFPGELAKDPSLAFLTDDQRTDLVTQPAPPVPAPAKAGAQSSDAARAARVWKDQAAFLVRFAKARGRIATGTGFDLAGYPLQGAGVHAEMAALVRAGLTPADAIRAATVNAAALVGAEKTIAEIAPGREADFFVVQGDPLARIGDLASISWVIRRGEVLDPKVLRARIKPGKGAPR